MLKSKYEMCKGCNYNGLQGFECAIYRDPWPTWERRQGQPCAAKSAYLRRQKEALKEMFGRKA